MKKNFFLVAAVMSMMFSYTAFAESNASVKVNGNEVIYDQKPIIEDGRVLVPMRATFEALGANIEWDNATRTVRASKGADNISIEVGKNELDVAAKIVNGRTLVPLRAVSEAFGADVNWDNSNRTVSITTNDGINLIDNSADSSDESKKHDYYTEYKAEDGTVLFMKWYDYDKLSDKTDNAVKEKVYARLKSQGDDYISNDNEMGGDEDIIKSAGEFYEERKSSEFGFSPFSSTIEYRITEESDKYISYKGNTYVYTGGVHGNGYLTCETFDAKTGEKLSLSDITGKSEDEIRKIRTEKLNEMIKNEPDMFYSSDTIPDINSLDDEVFDFYIKDGKIMVTITQTYLIAPYAAGFIEFEF